MLRTTIADSWVLTPVLIFFNCSVIFVYFQDRERESGVPLVEYRFGHHEETWLFVPVLDEYPADVRFERALVHVGDVVEYTRVLFGDDDGLVFVVRQPCTPQSFQ